MNTCPYVCNNKTTYGYCMSTACINPLYNRITVNQWLEKADYVQVVRCKDCKWLVTEEKTGYHLCGLEKFKTMRDLTDYCSMGGRKDK